MGSKSAWPKLENADDMGGLHPFGLKLNGGHANGIILSLRIIGADA